MTHRMPGVARYTLLAVLALLPAMACAGDDMHLQNFTTHWAGWLAVGLFVTAYIFVILEESLHLRKSKPTMVAAGLIWTIVAVLYMTHGEERTITLHAPVVIPDGMVYVPAGTFHSGGEESPVYRFHKREMPAYYIKKKEVTIH